MTRITSLLTQIKTGRADDVVRDGANVAGVSPAGQTCPVAGRVVNDELDDIVVNLHGGASGVRVDRVGVHEVLRGDVDINGLLTGVGVEPEDDVCLAHDKLRMVRMLALVLLVNGDYARGVEHTVLDEVGRVNLADCDAALALKVNLLVGGGVFQCDRTLETERVLAKNLVLLPVYHE